MAISSSSSSSSSDKEVQNCSKQCLESFKTLQKNYDSEREKHSRARLEIQGYELALESLESRILVHEKNELAWGEKYEFQNYELKCREIKINNLNLELEKVVKERDELKLKIEKWEESSKNLDELLNSQMSARDKTGLGYGTQLNEMSNNSETDSEISLSVFDVRSSDEENTPANDRIFQSRWGNPEILLQDHAVVDSGCSSHMTGTRESYLTMEALWLLEVIPKELLDESQYVLKALRKDDVYSYDYRTLCDNGTEFKNHAMNDFFAKKGIKREFSVARTPQQNGVAERKNRTLIKLQELLIALTVYNQPKKQGTKKVEENLHIDFLEDQPNVAGTGPNWMFDLDFLTNSMNYIPVSVENQVNVDACTQDSYVTGSSGKDKEPSHEYILLFHYQPIIGQGI
ncbi:putative ribonuclease H-like domain-containing protein [Tanacetum coccineum]